MRNFAKIFTAIVVAFAAYSCVADATEDLGVQVGNGEGKTTITLSLEESRTQLGEKTGDVYPLYWSAGDQIAVNGTASTALGEEWDGKSSASFTVEGVTLPYSIVYPAPAEAALEEWEKETVEVTDPETGEPVVDAEGNPVTEEVDVLKATLYPVTFPASQKYVANGIDGASAPMYGYSTKEGEVPTLKHLVGLLQFNVLGEGKVLKNIVVKSERGAIAGTYYVNCEKNLLVVKEGSTLNQVSMSFGDGLALGAEATTFYVTVPAGSYGTFVATLYTDTEKMTVKFNSDVLPIAAGYVREFAPFTFVHNDNDTDEEFIIDSEEALIEFASIAKAFYPRTVARVTKSLDMSEKSWTPIEGFGNFVFDGGSEQGYTIKGLKAPLFGTTSGKIQNVTLEGVNLTSNGQLIMGAIANTLTSGGQAEKASLTNCKAIGTLTISNPEWTPTSSQDKDVKIVNYGGLVGRSLGADLVNCTNQVAVTVSNMTATSNSTKVVSSSIGGVVGYVNVATLYNAEEATTNITNCDNDAAISYHCTSSAESKALIGRPHLGGVMGCGEKGANLEDCENTANGKISLNSHFYGEDGASGGVPVGGVVGYHAHGYLTRCTNNATVEADGIYKSLIIGGVGGYVTYCYTDGATNNGAVEVKSTARIRGILAGGVAGSFYGDGNEYDHYFKNCTNNATLKVLASAEENWTTSTASQASYYYRIGGITGFGRIKTTGGCTNTENGDITVSGNVKIATYSKWYEEALVIAGCVAFKTSGTPTGTWENYGDITVDATFSFDDDTMAYLHPIAISGVFGPQPGNPKHGYNEGKITFNGKYEGAGTIVEIGGIYAGGVKKSDGKGNDYHNKTPLESTNKGDITIGENAVISSTNLYVGGIIGKTAHTATITSAENEGDITISSKAQIGGKLYVGGIYGQFSGGNLANITNSGDLTVDCNLSGGKLAIAGIAPYNITGKTLTDITNTGNITITGTYTKGINVGGILSEMASGSTGKALRVVNGALGADDKGKIIFSGTSNYNTSARYEQALVMAGLFGACDYSYRPGNMEDCHNYGDLEVSGTVKGKLFFTGMSMACLNNSTTVKNCSQEGDLTMSGELSNVSNGQMYISGFCYTIDKTITFTNFQNKGNITVTDQAKIYKVSYIMGVGGYRNSSATFDGCSNSGNIAFNGTFNCADNSLYMGGLGGQRIASVTIKNGFTNSGNISFGGSLQGGKTSYPANLYISGLGVINGTAQVFNSGEIKNTGKISFTGSHNTSEGSVYLGGLFSYVPASVTSLEASETVSFVNEGLIEVTGTSATPANVLIGGIVGNSLSPIKGATANCNIKAINFPYAGMIMGSVRSDTVKAINCKVGGNMIFDTRETTKDDPDGGDPIEVTEDVLTPLTATNWFEYIYGDPVTEDVATTVDGCSLL